MGCGNNIIASCDFINGTRSGDGTKAGLDLAVFVQDIRNLEEGEDLERKFSAFLIDLESKYAKF